MLRVARRLVTASTDSTTPVTASRMASERGDVATSRSRCEGGRASLAMALACAAAASAAGGRVGARPWLDSVRVVSVPGAAGRNDLAAVPAVARAPDGLLRVVGE